MLDTDTVSYHLRDQGNVRNTVEDHHPWEICVSVLTVAQLRVGATRRKSPRLHRLIDAFLGDVAVLPFDEKCANRYAEVASDLARRGTPIGEFDTLIAAHALTLDLILVTNNVKHFRRVRGLEVENWL